MNFVCEKCGHIHTPTSYWEFYAKTGEMIILCQATVKEKDKLFIATCNQVVGIEGHGQTEEQAVADLQAQIGYPYIRKGDSCTGNDF